MTLPASGAISMSQVNTELGYASNAQIDLNATAVRSLAGKPSGVIAMSDLYGKTAPKAVPSGLIVMLQTGSVPAGWTRFSAADSKFIVGAGTTYSVTSTGGSSTVNSTSSTSSTGSHNGHGTCEADPGSYFGSYDYYIGGNDYGGDHYHTITYSNYTPAKQNMILMKANASYDTLPANAMGFATSTIAGYTAYSSSSFLCCAASVGTASSVITTSIGYDGGHNHYGQWGANSVNSAYGVYPGGSDGAQTHSISSSVTNGFKQAIMRGIYQASSYIPASGLVGLWEGSTAPAKWTLCDGSNGTVDLRDYFILFSATGTGSKSGTNSITFTVTINSDSWSHSHIYNASNMRSNGWPPGAYSYYDTISNSHSHTVSNKVVTYTPPYYALTFIQYTG